MMARQEIEMSDMVERVARAIDEADVGFNLRLTRLVDGVETYTLTYGDGTGPFEFDDMDDGYEHIRQRKYVAKARAAIEAMRAPDAHMSVEGHDEAERALGHMFHGPIADRMFKRMINAALTGEPEK